VSALLRLAAGLARRICVGADADLVLKPSSEPAPPDHGPVHLYVHLPFCRNRCPFCPYHKQAWDPALATPYLEAVLLEAGLHRRRWGTLTAASLYLGGGTPTLLADRLPWFIDRLNAIIPLSGPVAVEVSPEVCSPGICRDLRRAGTTQVSLGAQSFSNAVLATLGRRHNAATTERAVSVLAEGGFSGLNVDLLFAVDGQSDDATAADLARAIALGATQVTCYPLFHFVGTAVARDDGAGIPSLRLRHRQFRRIRAAANAAGLQPMSVWSFGQPGTPRYSSVTRQGYLGLGASAASASESGICVNTFSLDAYHQRVREGRFPIALRLDLSRRTAAAHWLYWRIYEGFIDRTGLESRFGMHGGAPGRLLAAARLAGLAVREAEGWRLTGPGSFWVHLLQNHAVLDATARLWDHASRDAFPPGLDLA
jgi:coproporphyrinogen III oxidase-like Fe-S oxidoreductase